jgi:NTP pyrophosphatase (non-canonical NTP hydrolase)
VPVVNGIDMNENPYEIDDDIAQAENRQMRLNEGRRLADDFLRRLNDGKSPSSLPWNGNQLSCICEAAVESVKDQGRSAEYEKQISELKGEIIGLKSQLGYAKEGSGADAYQRECLRTKGKHAIPLVDLATLGLGVAGEAGEVADCIKKHIGHGHKLDTDKIAKELGDTLWYIATIADWIGLPLSTVMNMNLEKLKKRYANGFSTEASIARVDVSPHSPSIFENSGDRLLSDLVSDLRQGLDVEAVPVGYQDCYCGGAEVAHCHIDGHSEEERPSQPTPEEQKVCINGRETGCCSGCAGCR